MKRLFALLLCAALLATVLRTQRPEWAVGLSLLAGALVAVAGYALLRALGVVSRGGDVVQSNCKVSVENEVGNPIGDS